MTGLYVVPRPSSSRREPLGHRGRDTRVVDNEYIGELDRTSTVDVGPGLGGTVDESLSGLSSPVASGKIADPPFLVFWVKHWVLLLCISLRAQAVISK